jgi:uncharacterized MAPEG superfamily protein
MTVELQMLAWSVVLGFTHIVLASHAKSWQYGYRCAAGARDEPRPNLSGVAGRLERAAANFLETFPFFAAAVLSAHVAGAAQCSDILGCAGLFLGARSLPAALRIRRACGPFDNLECRRPGNRTVGWEYWLKKRNQQFSTE